MAVRALPTGQGPAPARPRSIRPGPAMPWRGLAAGGLRWWPLGEKVDPCDSGGHAGGRAGRRVGGRGAGRRRSAPLQKGLLLARRRWRGRRRGPRRLTLRAGLLAIVILALGVTYAFPLQTFFSQQAQISRMRADQEQQRQHIEELKEQLARWDDPDYVTRQARVRLHLVREGELLYVVGEPPSAPGGTRAPDPAAWYSQLWASVQAADDPDQ